MSAPVIRTAREADLPRLCALLTDRGEAADAEDLRLVSESPGLQATVVAEVEGRVAATATLLDEQVRIGSVTVPAGQVELVAADRDHEHQGLVRHLMSWCHARSRSQGHLLQVMIGIPNFYRQFGYSYAMPMHPWAPLEAPVDEVHDGPVVRLAGPDDLGAMQQLQDLHQAQFDAAMPHQPACWTWLVKRSGSVQWVVESRGSITGSARVAVDDDVVLLGEVAATDAAAARALVAEAARSGPDGAERWVQRRPGVPALDAWSGPPNRPDWYYVRIPDPALLLESLRPELSRRLRTHGWDDDRTATLSFWRSHVTFDVGPKGVGPVVAGGPFQAPVSAGGSGVPEDALGALLLGSGAAGLEDRFPDALLGRQAELMTVLFPPQTSDLLTFYLPA
jgi:predicted N-acetyltransferase YhbS